MKVLVAYDGTLDAKTALRYGLEKVRGNGGELIVLHVFNRNLFIDYDAIPQAEEIARRESSRYIEEAERIIKEEGKGIKASIILDEGNPEKETIECAKAENVDLLLCPPRYKALWPAESSAVIGGFRQEITNHMRAYSKAENI